MASSLETLVSNILKNKLVLTTDILHSKYPNVSDDVIYGKGVFPYDFMNNVTSLDCTQLPSKNHFNNTLRNNKPISDSAYARASTAWREFNCVTFKDYMEAYLTMDVLQLADVFESFRSTIYYEHDLDSVNYVTLPSLAWSLATKMNPSFHLLTDPEKYQFFEDKKRGGMSFINEHVVSASPTQPLFDNQAIKRFKCENADEWIACHDANNLYGEAMCALLPCSHFSWVEPDELNKIDWYTMVTEGSICYILKEDLEYPKIIHDLTADLQLAPENGDVTWEMLTAQQK